jgi:hypothetical protein
LLELVALERGHLPALHPGGHEHRLLHEVCIYVDGGRRR